MTKDAKPEAPAPRDDRKERDELLSELGKAEEIGAPLEAAAQDVVEAAREQRDLARTFRQLVEILPPEECDWTPFTSTWRTQNMKAAAAKASIAGTYGFIVQTSSTATSTSTAVVSAFLLPTLDSLEQLKRLEPARAVERVLKRRVNIDDLRQLFTLFDMHLRRGEEQKAPLELLNDAHIALKRPTQEEPVGESVLLPLRECIHRVIDQLLKRSPLPQQQQGGVESKVSFIGRGCRLPRYPESFFTDLGRQAKIKLGNLSELGKGRVLSRDELEVPFDDGVHFLTRFLEALDPQRLR